MVDPPVVDELSDEACITELKNVYRKTVSHALNLKETARRHACAIGRKYEECNLIVCHIGGGISITVHKHGRMVDGNDAGGLSSWFGTSNSDEIHALVEKNDATAVRVWNAMIYQIIKWIGMMSTVLKGNVDGIVLTGGLLRFPEIQQRIEESCGWIAPISAYPGDAEQEAMAINALQVRRGELVPKNYSGHPVWNGFRTDC